jgi:hypothetical protein
LLLNWSMELGGQQTVGLLAPRRCSAQGCILPACDSGTIQPDALGQR